MSNVIFSLSQWAILISIARFGNVEMVGQYTLGLAIIAPILGFTSLKSETIYITDQNEQFKFKDYFSVRLFTSIISILILILILSIRKSGYITLIVILLVALFKIIESMSELLYATMQKKEHVKFISISKAIKGILTFLLISFALYYTNDLIIGLIFVVILYFVMFIFFDLKNSLKFEKVKIKITAKYFYQIIIRGLPLGMVYLLTSLNTNMPRYFVEQYFNVEILGYFAAISYIVVNNVNIFTNALNNIIIPRFSILLSEKKGESIKKLIRRLEYLGLTLGVISIIFVFLFGDIVLTIIYGSEYSAYANLFKILILSTVFLFISSFHSCLIFAAKYFKIQPVLGVIWLISSVLFLYLLIPKYGLEGVAYSVVLVSIIQFISRYIVLKKVMNNVGVK